MRRPAFWLTFVLAILCLSVGVAFAQQLPTTSGVTVLVNRDGVNVRLIPALGAEVIGFVNAGYTADALARSPDNEWVRVSFNGEEGWIGLAVLTVLAGDVNSLPVRDPRTMPYGGFESPRAGLSSATSPVQGELPDNGVRVRAGPSRAYPILANAPRRTVFPLLGRTVNNSWFQVNYLGTLGWVTAQEVVIQGAVDVNQLPVDGIVAEAPPMSNATAEDYLGTLRLLRDRINLAQPSLDAIRGLWTNVAIGGQPTCGSFPARPTGYNVPNPLLAVFFDTLNPVQLQFNDAMANVRGAIDLFIDLCSRGSVEEAIVRQALDMVNRADVQFAELRRRLTELIPPDEGVGPDECLFVFDTAFDILKLLQLGRIYVDHFTPDDTLTGYCFDATQGQSLTISAVTLTGNTSLFMAVSPFDNPTNFLAVQTGSVQRVPVQMVLTAPATGRYLLIVSDVGGQFQTRAEPPFGDFAVLVNPVGATADPAQAIDLATGQPATGYDVTPILGVSTAFPTPGFVMTPGVGVTPGVSTPVPQLVPDVVFCPGLNLTCNQLTCEQAAACLAAGNFTLDPDNDMIPCEEQGCT